MNATILSPTLEEQRMAFNSRRFLNMPLAGTICWSIVGLASPFLSQFYASLLVFIATGSIVYLAMGLSKITKEPFFHKEKNDFDRLFLGALVMALLVFSIAIPFFIKEPRSITLSVGILTGLMWMPFSWILQHWIGYFHAIARTALVLVAWYVFPEHHFQVIPAIIVVIYLITIYVLEKRWRTVHQRLSS